MLAAACSTAAVVIAPIAHPPIIAPSTIAQPAAVSTSAVAHEAAAVARSAIFPTTDLLASGTPTGVATPGGGLALYGGLGAPKANRANPGGAGNAEGNWCQACRLQPPAAARRSPPATHATFRPPRWTPSYVLDTDCDGNRVTPTTKLSQECIYKKKTEEIKQKQAINALNAEYKVEKLAQLERQAAERTAKNAARAEEVAARQAKYANRR